MAEASIVFRNKDMSSTGKIYVDYMDAAAMLAAKYRNASYYVDVINRWDEVAYRWEDGKPAWGDDIQAIIAQVESYQFERLDDPFWVAENQVLLLAEALPYAFDVATGKEDQYAFDSLLVRTDHGDDEIWGLIGEAHDVAKAARSLGADEWAQKIEEWMENSQSLFLNYRIEYTALSINSDLFISNCRVARLEVELTDLEMQNR